MSVAELMAWLSRQNPESPITIMGISESGDSVQEADIVLGTGQGPTDDIDDVIISWAHPPEWEARYELRS